MGQLLIEAGGSFPSRRKVFGAMDHGHAHAVAQAIEYLSREVLPGAIAQDHRLHGEGSTPTRGFTGPRPDRSIVFKGADDEWYWHVEDGDNGKTLVASEGHKNRTDAVDAAMGFPFPVVEQLDSGNRKSLRA